MNKLVFFFAGCLALLQIASALECYSCTGPACATEMKTWEKRTCGASGTSPPANHQYVCLKQSLKDKASQKKMIERKCVLAPLTGGKPTYDCSQVVGDQVECPVCQTDLCNAAPTLGLSLTTLGGVVVVAFLAPKLL